jgi:hypothetical protein
MVSAVYGLAFGGLWRRRGDFVGQSMIPKSGDRFSEKIMLQQKYVRAPRV